MLPGSHAEPYVSSWMTARGACAGQDRSSSGTVSVTTSHHMRPRNSVVETAQIGRKCITIVTIPLVSDNHANPLASGPQPPGVQPAPKRIILIALSQHHPRIIRAKCSQIYLFRQQRLIVVKHTAQNTAGTQGESGGLQPRMLSSVAYNFTLWFQS